MSQPEEIIAQQNDILIQANEDMIIQSENKQISEEASSTLEEIQNALVTSTKRRRVETLTTCTEFEETYREFLEAIINLIVDEDTNIPIIRTLTPVLQATVEADIPCSDQEREDLKTETQVIAETASNTVSVFIEEIEERIEEIVEIVRIALEKIEEANTELISMGETTIPAVTFVLPTQEPAPSK